MLAWRLLVVQANCELTVVFLPQPPEWRITDRCYNIHSSILFLVGVTAKSESPSLCLSFRMPPSPSSLHLQFLELLLCKGSIVWQFLDYLNQSTAKSSKTDEIVTTLHLISKECTRDVKDGFMS